MKELGRRIYDWKLLSKNVKEIHKLCSGLGMLRTSSNALDKAGTSLITSMLMEEHESTIYVAYRRCLDQYNGKYSNKHKKYIEFVYYMSASIYQKLGRILYRMLPVRIIIHGQPAYYLDIEESEESYPVFKQRDLALMYSRIMNISVRAAYKLIKNRELLCLRKDTLM